MLEILENYEEILQTLLQNYFDEIKKKNMYNHVKKFIKFLG